MSTSIITLQGRLTADAELTFHASGAAMLTFGVADNHRKKTGDQWADDGTSFWRVTLWRDDAEAYAERLHKGTLVVVTGEPRIREYENRDGGKGKSAEIHRAIVGIREHVQRGGQQRPAGNAAAATARHADGLAQDDPWATPATVARDTEAPF